jgi:hypothetical protein
MRRFSLCHEPPTAASGRMRPEQEIEQRLPGLAAIAGDLRGLTDAVLLGVPDGADRLRSALGGGLGAGEGQPAVLRRSARSDPMRSWLPVRGRRRPARRWAAGPCRAGSRGSKLSGYPSRSPLLRATWSPRRQQAPGLPNGQDNSGISSYGGSRILYPGTGPVSRPEERGTLSCRAFAMDRSSRRPDVMPGRLTRRYP